MPRSSGFRFTTASSMFRSMSSKYNPILRSKQAFPSGHACEAPEISTSRWYATDLLYLPRYLWLALSFSARYCCQALPRPLLGSTDHLLSALESGVKFQLVISSISAPGYVCEQSRVLPTVSRVPYALIIDSCHASSIAARFLTRPLTCSFKLGRWTWTKCYDVQASG